MRAAITALCLLLGIVSLRAAAAETGTGTQALERRFRDTVQPFLQTYCVACHGKAKPRGDLDLSAYTNLQAIARDHDRWETVLEELDAEAMPPAEAKRHPRAELRAEVMAWIQAVRKHQAVQTAGDPGRVPARRLSNAEYDYTIRDLTGVDIRPTREFPVDPANEAGFDNSAESLTMSPALLKKYLEAARRVADHLVLKPEGLAFASHPMVADTDRDKYCVRQIIAFYQRQRTDYADYFLAAWRFQHRAALGRPEATLAEFAHEARLSPRYLATIWSTLTLTETEAETPEELGPIAALQALWRELPGSEAPGAVRAGCERMRDFVVVLRRQLTPEVKNLTAPGIQNGSQTMVLWKDRQMAANRRRYTGGALAIEPAGLGLAPGSAAARALTVPAGADATARARYEAAFGRFCGFFPDAFFISERARVYLDPEKEKQNAGRLLSAGFHSMTGYFRDDAPLSELLLDPAEQRVLDALWEEFDFITGAPMRQHTSFIWFERTDSRYMRDPEFDFARAEDKDATSPAKIARLAEVYLAKARASGASATALGAIGDHFRIIAANIRRVEQARRRAEPLHVAALQAVAERAYRRPLSNEERAEVAAFYGELRAEEGLSHEDAVRDTLVRVLMSPHFCYRIDLPAAGGGSGRGTSVQPLSDYALASRLSYFLWSSMPDAELLARAAAGDLHRPEVLAAQARRLMRDDRVRGLAVEFGGNWLDFRRFEEHNSVDRGRFPSFNDELRSAMFEEPVRFFLDVIGADRPVLDLLEANHTFVNPVLARHYGMPELDAGVGPDEWVRIADAQRYGRGGLLPMAVFLTRNAPGLRTSPVKRGYWVVRRLLGEEIPAPPAQVPELPSDEAKLGELTLREALARHRADQSCAGCHERFDSIGLAFEGYGPVGELRTIDLGGRPVDTRASFPRGGEGTGVEGLRSYLRDRRQEEFVENLCRKLLAYALGRSLLPSDDGLVEELGRELASSGYRFGTLVEGIVISPQFRNQRVEGDQAEE
jgi:cytochrome c553